MIAVGLDKGSLNTTLSIVRATAKEIASAERRAVGAGASLLRSKMREFVKSGGRGWGPLHPITKLADPAALISWKLNHPYQRKAPGMSKAQQATLLGFLATNKASGAVARATLAEARMDLKSHERMTARTQTGFLGKLANIFWYSLKTEGGGTTAVVGVLAEKTSEKARYMFDRFQEGGRLPGSYMPAFSQPSMLRYWGGLGRHLRRSTTLNQPPRDVVLTVWEINRDLIQQTINDKFEERLMLPKESF